MKNLRRSFPILGGILLLTCTWGLLLAPEGSQGQGKKTTSKCQISFTVTFSDASSDKLTSDGLGPYVDGQDKIMASTGSGPGFRLDTNGGSQKLEGAGGFRTLCIDFVDVTTVPPAPFDGACKGIDLRFFLKDGGLDLCSLEVDSPATVGLHVAFEHLGEPWQLSYGIPETQDGGPIIGQRVDVTRTGTDTWTISGQTAGLRSGDLYGTVVADNLTMPFTMYLLRN